MFKYSKNNVEYPCSHLQASFQQSEAQASGSHRPEKRRPGKVFQAILAGAVAVWVMDRFDWFAFNHEDRRARQQTESVRPGPRLDPAHALAAKLAKVFGLRLAAAPAHRHPAGLAVHYAVPMGLTYLYLVLRRRVPAAQIGSGSIFGAGCFLVLDQVVNPALGLAADPRQYPWQRNVRELVSHCIYGLVTHSILNRFQRQRGKRI